MFGLLFLLPAMLLVRREVALVAAILVTTYLSPAIWLAILGVAWTLLASARWPWLLVREAARRRARPAAPRPAGAPSPGDELR